ncbi:TonB system transport protein ExbD [Testudinibacter sp. TR-2022]|nr:TonB system transport protein ExbD [Testudinibacter sp. TR-2022]TNH05540.1 TonB system transport protein ExbD [Pasteurellaceae bacterium Phil31]TNH11572.1 TonB system transport protein ExbD [Testudinibacter sp. TR-2022]TNH11939.1 TonB system transport protein ExbD [Testudinibacter sp. TR-2022]TNH12635.1 TonB system transport protein ExbD [Testudinibacter sp. TR-2022]TNH18049.1 TonB system transport protein ExbD [Testudinibacter sp. TR-2022]
MSFHLSDSTNEQELSEINVTPFIDVMLVLLIIFMVTIPLTTVTVPIDLPIAKANVEPQLEKPIILSLNQQQELFLGNEPLLLHNLATALDQLTVNNRDTVIFFQVDKTIPYEILMNVMNQLRTAGYLKIGLVGLENKE